MPTSFRLFFNSGWYLYHPSLSNYISPNLSKFWRYYKYTWANWKDKFFVFINSFKKNLAKLEN